MIVVRFVATDNDTFCRNLYLNVDFVFIVSPAYSSSLRSPLFSRYSFETPGCFSSRGRGREDEKERRVLGPSVKPLFVAANVPLLSELSRDVIALGLIIYV